MSIWKRWFAKHTGPSPPRIGATCPFCGGAAVQCSLPKTVYAVWESECGAVGSGSLMHPDLDEVADGLLAVLGIGGSVSEPSMPTGSSGMVSMQHYDIPKSLIQLQAILRGCGFDMQTNTWNESGCQMHSIWARRTVA